MTRVCDISPAPPHARLQPRELAITKAGSTVLVEVGDITAIKWDPPILTILLFDTVLMTFRESDAEAAYERLYKIGIRTDDSLGKVPF